jgi:hypothetical protein
MDITEALENFSKRVRMYTSKEMTAISDDIRNLEKTLQEWKIDTYFSFELGGEEYLFWNEDPQSKSENFRLWYTNPDYEDGKCIKLIECKFKIRARIHRLLPQFLEEFSEMIAP